MEKEPEVVLCEIFSCFASLSETDESEASSGGFATSFLCGSAHYMKRLLIRFTPGAFALLMIVIGVVDFFRPEPVREAMHALDLPVYLLWILGTAKVLGGGAILLDLHERLTEWAFAGFFIWGIGGIACHFFSGHGIGRTTPIVVLFLFLVISYLCYRARASNQENGVA